MTVHELIEELNKITNQNAEVTVNTNDKPQPVLSIVTVDGKVIIF